MGSRDGFGTRFGNLATAASASCLQHCHGPCGLSETPKGISISVGVFRARPPEKESTGGGAARTLPAVQGNRRIGDEETGGPEKTRIVSVAVQVRQPGETGVPGRHQKRAYPKAICNWHSNRKPRPREMWRSRVPESKSAMDHKACRRLPRKISISQAIFHARLPEKGDTGGGATAKPFPHSQAPHANHPGVVKIPYLEPVRTRARNGKQGGKLDSNPVTLGR
jgi:hypothetical protein